MSAKIVAKHKISRRLGVNIWGDPKSPFNTRPSRPGQHGASRKKKTSFYGSQLQEKQKIQFYYGMNANQMKLFFARALKKQGNVIDSFIGLLESRLDAVVFKAKWAPTIYAAKQMVKHKHILVNGNLVNISSYLVSPNDVISLKDDIKNHNIVIESMKRAHKQIPPYYESIDEGRAIKFIKRPNSTEAEYPFSINSSLVVGFYSNVKK